MPSFTDRVRRLIGMNTTTTPAAMHDAGMDSSAMLGPSQPTTPRLPFAATPRSHDYSAGYNVATRPRTHERVSFTTLKGFLDSYDVAQLAITHAINDVRSMDYNLKAAQWYRGDADTALDAARKVMRRPDGELPFKSWLAKYLEDVLRYDAGTLYRVRNRRREVIGLRVIDGTTIAPLLDYFGNRPKPPAPAFVQYAQGIAWDWLSADDIIYVPYRPQPNSPYGRAPIEMVLLNANTDLRFQTYFLSRFTEGTIPEGFIPAPDSWTPDQIDQFQQAWDDMLYGDEAAKHQIKWIPGGSGTPTWHKDQTFDVELAKWLERKTLVAFGRIPADMGITDDVNRATGDTQADVQFRIGTLPLVQHLQEILDDFLQNDLGLPVVGRFDTGQETKDRVQTAQADAVYLDRAVVSSDEIREMRYGLPVDNDRPFGRVWFAPRPGPIPVAAIDAVAGPIDPQTHAPTADAELPKQVFAPIPGVAPEKPPEQPPLAVDRFGDAAAIAPDQMIGTNIDKSETAGVTADTGVHGSPLVEDEDEDEESEVAKAERQAFSRFVRSRRKAGTWRDFAFTTVPAVQAHRLNDAGRAEVRKAAGQLVAAGLAVRAADTGRVLMLQRAHDDTDPASGMVEFPGGHIETGESPYAAARREWQEETGLLLPLGTVTGSWQSANGVYAGYVLTVASEADLAILDRTQVNNPDDPDGDLVEALLWLSPEQIAGNPIIRAELAADLQVVLDAIRAVAKAGGADPKAADPRWHGPARPAEERASDHHAPAIRSAIETLIPREQLARLVTDYLNRSR